MVMKAAEDRHSCDVAYVLDGAMDRSVFAKGPMSLSRLDVTTGGAPDFVEVGEAGIAVDNAMRRQRRVQLVG